MYLKTNYVQFNLSYFHTKPISYIIQLKENNRNKSTYFKNEAKWCEFSTTKWSCYRKDDNSTGIPSASFLMQWSWHSLLFAKRFRSADLLHNSNQFFPRILDPALGCPNLSDFLRLTWSAREGCWWFHGSTRKRTAMYKQRSNEGAAIWKLAWFGMWQEIRDR